MSEESIAGYYDWHGWPAFIWRGQEGGFFSGIFDVETGRYEYGGVVRKIVWDGLKISEDEGTALTERVILEAGQESEGLPYCVTPDQEKRFVWHLTHARALFRKQIQESKTTAISLGLRHDKENTGGAKGGPDKGKQQKLSDLS